MAIIYEGHINVEWQQISIFFKMFFVIYVLRGWYAFDWKHSCSATKAILQFKLLNVKLIINLSGEDELE